jgi:3-deoxy-D-manno-octulosonic-acid transferase
MMILLLLLNLIFILIFTLIDNIKYNITFNEYLQRLGIHSNNYYDFLIHGASCGEVNSAIPLINILEEQGKRVLLTCQTITSYRNIKSKVKYVILKPYEHPVIILNFLFWIKFKNMIIIERDIWPIYIGFAKLFKIHTSSINYSYKTNRYIINRLHRYFLDTIYLKEKLKLNNKKYIYLGNIKFLNINTVVFNKKKNMLVICSAHKEELSIHITIIDFCIKNSIKVVYIPRHLNYRELIKTKFNRFKYYFLKDSLEKDLDNIVNTHNFIICHCFGLIPYFLSLSKITIMGGTYNNTGGHNFIEPVINKNYVITGPNYSTQKDIVNILNTNDCIKICNNTDKIKSIIQKILKNKNDLNLELKNINNYKQKLLLDIKHIFKNI